MPKDMPDHESESENENELSFEDEKLLTHPSYQELQKKLDEADQKANQYWERILRMQADSENQQRRVERDLSNAHKYALEKFVTELLPIIDSLELCVENAAQDYSDATVAVIEGVKLTLKMFYNTLEKFGVQQINPGEETFDPEFQQAISVQVDPSVPANTVLSVLQKGYTLNNRLLRPALVTVSKAED